MRREGEAGSGRTGFVLTLAFLGVAIFLGAKVIPVRVNAYHFRDVLRQEARLGAVRSNDETVARRIMEEAAELDIPLARENLKIKRTRSKMIVTARYERPIDLKVTTYVYKFSHREVAPLF